MCSAGGRRASSPGGFSHSETHGSCGHVPLAVDYRGLSRPSSASCAKASTVCPWYPSRRHRRRPSFSRYISCMMRSTNWRIFVCVTLCGSQGAAGAGPGDRTPCASRRDEVHDQRAWSSDGTRPSEMMSGSLFGCLPRKEVIQPHLPVRLPCYDFTPLTSHTFGASPHCWLGRRLRVQSTRVV